MAQSAGELVRICGCDPGKQRDSFALCSLVVDPSENTIFVEYAMRWLRVDYLKVEEQIANLHKQAKWLNIYVEQNNTGEHVIEVLKKQYGMPVKAITTYGKMSDTKKHHQVKSMSKPEMVFWYLKAKQKHLVKFPRNSKNHHMKELERQISIFSEHKTDAGNAVYQAPGEEHDDLVMALLIACFAARKWIRIEGSTQASIAGGFNYQRAGRRGGIETILGGGDFDDWA